MPFDPTSAQPETGGGFDPTTASPDTGAPANKGGFWRNVGAGLEEFPGAMANLIGNSNPGGFPYSDKPTDRDPAADISHAVGKVTGLDPASVPSNTLAEKTGRVLGGMLPALAAPEAEAPELAAEGAPLASEVVSRFANSPIATLGKRAATLGGAATGSTVAQAAVPDDDPVLKSVSGRPRSDCRWRGARSRFIGAGDYSTDQAVRASPLHKAGQSTDRGRYDPRPGHKPSSAGYQSGAHQFRNRARLHARPLSSKPGIWGLAAWNENRPPKILFCSINGGPTKIKLGLMPLLGVQSGGNPDDVGTFLRGQFRDFDDQTQQHIDTLTANAQQQAEALGGTGAPEVHGAAIRDALQQAETAARTKERSLWQAVDPDRNLMVGHAADD